MKSDEIVRETELDEILELKSRNAKLTELNKKLKGFIKEFAELRSMYKSDDVQARAYRILKEIGESSFG